MPFDLETIDSGATAWVLVSSALVLLMTPGLAFFYGGMVRVRHVLTMLMQNFVTIAVVGVVWVLLGFSLAFGDGGGLIGDFSYAGLGNLGDVVPGYVDDFAQVIPPVVFVAFQLMFAIITPALITGAIADRVKFGAFVVFVAAWSLLVYAPVAHWVFSPTGWLFDLGALDFAGGTVVHINAGAAGLALALVLGRRVGWPREQMRPHNVPFILLGAALLWFGWFGFNAGSALGANALAGYAFVNTNTATAAAILAWIGVERLRDGHATTLGAASGAVAGLVAITPAAGFVTPLGAAAIGLMAGGACALAVTLKFRFGFDDSLDVVAVHLIGGILGSLSVGLFATTSVNSLGADGLFYGDHSFSLLGKQWVAVLVVAGFSFIVTAILGKAIDMLLGMRMSADDQREGLDSVLHGETAYEFGGGLGGAAVTGGHRPTVPAAAVRQEVDA
jgi:Amt family ammonium transporter